MRQATAPPARVCYKSCDLQLITGLLTLGIRPKSLQAEVVAGFCLSLSLSSHSPLPLLFKYPPLLLTGPLHLLSPLPGKAFPPLPRPALPSHFSSQQKMLVGPCHLAPSPKLSITYPLLDFSWGAYQPLPFSTTAVELPLKGRNLVAHRCVPSTSPYMEYPPCLMNLLEIPPSPCRDPWL